MQRRSNQSNTALPLRDHLTKPKTHQLFSSLLTNFTHSTTSSSHQKFWSKSFKKHTFFKSSHPIQHLHFSSSGHSLAATVNNQIQFYVPSTHQHVSKTIQRFSSEKAYGAQFRKDGQLIVAGEHNGNVSVFQVQSRAVLRTFQGHVSPTHATCFLSSPFQVASGSDDQTVKVWDITSNTCIHTLQGHHQDYVRSLMTLPDHPHLLASAGYDHSMFLFDLRTPELPIFKFQHTHPIESLVYLESSHSLALSGGPSFQVLDLTAQKSMHHFSNHVKTITCLALSGKSSLLTGSLDRTVQVFDLADQSVVYTWKYASPVLSLAYLDPISMSSTSSSSSSSLSTQSSPYMAVGLLDGTLSLRSMLSSSKKSSSSGHKVNRTSSKPSSGHRNHFLRSNYRASVTDIQVKGGNPSTKASNTPYDQYIMRFEYSNALDSMFDDAYPPSLVVGLLEYLIEHRALERALQGRTEASLFPLLQFLAQHMLDPMYSETLMRVTHCILDMYSHMPFSYPFRQLWCRIRFDLKMILKFTNRMNQMLGVMELILASAEKEKHKDGLDDEGWGKEYE